MKKALETELAKKNGQHVRFDNFKKIDLVRRAHGYKSFAEFVREAVSYFIGWLEGRK